MARDRYDAIKERYEYAKFMPPGKGEEDVWWLIGEVERLRHRLDLVEQIVYREYEQ